MTSGARGAFVFTPVLLVLILVLDRGSGLRSVGIALAAIAGLLLIVSLVGTDVSNLAGAVGENASIQRESVLATGIRDASHHLVAGLGTGADTNAARHVADNAQVGVNGAWVEVWWVKAVLELGLAGLILSVALYGAIIGSGLRQHFRLVRPELRSASAAILALLIWTAIYNFKASYTDIDPLNVYFWLLAGILYKLGKLDRPSQDDAHPDRLPATAPVSRQ
jgi:hypothetical protein